MALINKIGFGKKKQEAKKTGKFIVIDGTDGSGKATQTNLLLETLVQQGFEVEKVNFPQYGKKSAGGLEEYLAGNYGDLNPQAASILYAIDRFDASFEIREMLNQGKIVIADRYVTANAGHQGGKIKDEAERIKFFKWLDNLEYGTFGIPKPDLNIILHVPAEMSQKLIAKRSEEDKTRKTDIHEKDLNHLKNAELVYLQIAQLFPNTKLVECVEQGRLESPEEIHNKVWELVRRIALKNILPSLESTK